MKNQIESINTADLAHVTGGGFDLSSIMGMIGPMLSGGGGGGGGDKKDQSGGGGGGGLGGLMQMAGPLLKMFSSGGSK
jgi:hypothetical protein